MPPSMGIWVGTRWERAGARGGECAGDRLSVRGQAFAEVANAKDATVGGRPWNAGGMEGGSVARLGADIAVEDQRRRLRSRGSRGSRTTRDALRSIDWRASWRRRSSGGIAAGCAGGRAASRSTSTRPTTRRMARAADLLQRALRQLMLPAVAGLRDLWQRAGVRRNARRLVSAARTRSGSSTPRRDQRPKSCSSPAVQRWTTHASS